MLKIAADCIDKAFGCYIDVHGIPHPMLQSAKTHGGQTLCTLSGKVLWTARQALWDTRCLFRFNNLSESQKYQTYVKSWIHRLRELARWPGAKAFCTYYKQMITSLQELLQDGTLIPRIYMGEWHSQSGNHREKKRKLNTEARVAPALAELQKYLTGSWLVFYTDGSAEHMDTVGWVGGFGIICPQLKIKEACPNPTEDRQTNNLAELLAVLWVLNRFTEGRVLIATDSKLVFDAMQGNAQKWCDNGWRCSSGPVGNVARWSELLDNLHRPGRELAAVPLPSHCNIIGNEVANDLAELGRTMNPLNVTHSERAQVRIFVLNETPPPGHITHRDGSELTMSDTPSVNVLHNDLYIDVDYGADCGLWGTPLPVHDLDFYTPDDMLASDGLPVARCLFE